ncbi:helix-turn-helix domain-containing protein [uncultured Tateyamaria sp.]|uniref:helix-turn-helix domain-containing protein n=1 Tax=uncultured Tateyamaria sp. TaxID=455651 RepID=UPI0026311299|nr:helix-turn-helix domain-containing protein [uncultured Tateyamaria sp.]
MARRFHEEPGTTPLDWLKVERVSRAAELLASGTISLSDVWEVSGFGSAETFCREFRKIMGGPPSDTVNVCAHSKEDRPFGSSD